MRGMTWIVVVMAAFTLAAVQARASNTVTGVVKNCSGVPVPSVLIFIRSVGVGSSCTPPLGVRSHAA